MTKRPTDPQKTERDHATAEVRALYLELGERPIERNCTRLSECCQFQLTGRTPYLTRGEALIAAQAFRATGRTRLPETADGSCPMLQPLTGRCMIYNDRPFACRTHFCAAAGGPYARREVADLIYRLEALDTQLGGSGARALPQAVRTALEQSR